MFLSMKRLLALAALLLLPAVGLMAEPQSRDIKAHDIKAPGITKDMLNQSAPQPPQQVCFKPTDVQSFAYRTGSNNLRINTSDARTYDVSFFIKCGGLSSTKALSFDGLANEEVCGSGMENVVFYSTEQGPKRCSIKDVAAIPVMARAGR
jgi:hypothetical protein